MEKKEPVFVDGMRFDRPKEGAPDFVKGRISVKLDDFIRFAQAHKNDRGYLNIDLKKSQKGVLYLQLDDWKPAPKPETDSTEGLATDEW